MKPIIKGLSMSFLAMSFLLPTNVSFAEQNIESTGALLNDPLKQTEEGKKLYEMGKEADKKMKEEEQRKQRIPHMRPSNERFEIPMEGNIQSKFYYCGPASVRQSLSFHKIDSGIGLPFPSQEQIAFSAGTEHHQASTSVGLVKSINQYRHDFDFEDTPYKLGDIEDSANPVQLLTQRVKTSLSNRTNAPILLVETENMQHYSKAPKNYRHYITVSGYYGNENSMRIQDANHIVHNNVAFGGEYKETIGDGSSKGVGKAVLMADKKGGNAVVIW
ncbi:C39 family peptidase [Bacillus mycoides]|uniref:C39 family peptidase n=1 Tax=Bacillus mycoides TaxID=1405 RepID=UPI0025A303BF|nr:C39 family peptidase [Bacillus mycoides]MDM5431256.1 C39 family peptidase [Bacillus mycoides]